VIYRLDRISKMKEIAVFFASMVIINKLGFLGKRCCQAYFSMLAS
jgi:hypothetical protein